MSEIPEIRVRICNDRPVREDGDYVLYWMIAFRRSRWNYAFDRAVDWARRLGKPLVVLEALRSDYRWASDRLHRFVLQGMADNAAALRGKPVLYYPYVEPETGAGRGLVSAVSDRACVVVTDEFPCFFLPHMVRALAQRVETLVEAVDSNGILPLRATDRVFQRAFDFRRFLQANLRDHLLDSPRPNPLGRVKLPALKTLPKSIRDRWPAAKAATLKATPAVLSELPIDHTVAPGAIDGGMQEADRALARFLDERFDTYADGRNHPDDDSASGLSPYLHFGHISPHEILARILQREDWGPQQLGEKTSGAREGWWGMSEAAESFLDQLITWRELGYNMTAHRDDYDRYESLPEWARVSLAKHASDPRPYVYDLTEFERAATHDPIWNAAQTQLVTDGQLHNYLRMLWGKKILHWAPSPQDALQVMIELNNKYALDGRNPNSYSGIFWTLGRYDRAWGPERPVFGKVRFMTSASTQRKLRLKQYLARYGSIG